METQGAKVVNGFLTVWNNGLLMVADETMEIKFNGILSEQLSNITDVQSFGNDLMVVGYVTNVIDVKFGGQKIDTSSWVASFLLGR